VPIECETDNGTSYCQGHVTFLVRVPTPTCCRWLFPEQDTFSGRRWQRRRFNLQCISHEATRSVMGKLF